MKLIVKGRGGKRVVKFIEAVLAVTETADDGELLQIRRASDAPVFARQ